MINRLVAALLFLSLGGCGQDADPEANSMKRSQEDGARAKRLDYVESCRALQRLGLLEEGETPQIPDRRPRWNDETTGVSFFRTLVEDVTLKDLTLRRVFAARSEFRNMSFARTDLTESSMCWNDFVGVDFGGAALRKTDLRASVFDRVNFSGADLSDADLRHAQFSACEFKGATLTRSLMTKQAAKGLPLSREQRASIAWQESDGDEPEGG